MIRPFTCVCMVLAAGSGLYLYQTKHRAQLLDREILRTLKQTDTVRERIGVLRAEWALLNEPERLAELARQHLGLQTMAPTQFTTLADLGSRLPPAQPPGSFAPPAHLNPGDPEEPGDRNEAIAAAKPAPPPAKEAPAVIAATPPAPPKRAEPVQAAAKPKPDPAPVREAAREPVREPKPAFTAAIMPVSASPARTQSAPPVNPNWIGESVARVARGLPPIEQPMERPVSRPAPRAEAQQAYAAPAPYAPAPYAPAAPPGSALGGNYRALPAPTPYVPR